MWHHSLLCLHFDQKLYDVTQFEMVDCLHFDQRLYDVTKFEMVDGLLLLQVRCLVLCSVITLLIEFNYFLRGSSGPGIGPVRYLGGVIVVFSNKPPKQYCLVCVCIHLLIMVDPCEYCSKMWYEISYNILLQHHIVLMGLY